MEFTAKRPNPICLKRDASASLFYGKLLVGPPRRFTAIGEAKPKPEQNEPTAQPSPIYRVIGNNARLNRLAFLLRR